MSEIATWSMIRSKIPSFPAPTSGCENECLTKSEILSMGGVKVSGSYGDNECVMIDDVSIILVYPCMSETDKTPLGSNILIVDVNNRNLHLSGFVPNIELLGLCVATNIDLDNGYCLVYSPTLKANSGEAITYNGKSIGVFHGNYIEISGSTINSCPILAENMCSNMRVIIQGITYRIQFRKRK